MSHRSSDATNKLRVWKYVQEIALTHPTISMTATGIAQRLDLEPKFVRGVLDGYAQDGFLQLVPVERCENGHLCANELDDDVTQGEGSCLQCGPSTITRYATFKATKALTSFAKENAQGPKALRRRMTLLGMTQRALRRRHLCLAQPMY